jgi:S-adenosylmethionine:tRNA ribosyltransferase-isomerase
MKRTDSALPSKVPKGDDEPGAPSPSEDIFRTDAYAYDLPKEMIAQHPATPRDASRLLVLDRRSLGLRHARFRDLPDVLQPGDVLVVNESRVLAARLLGRSRDDRETEVLLVEAVGGIEEEWRALLGSARGAGPGFEVRFRGGWRAVVTGVEENGARRVRLHGGGSLEGFLDEQGHVPLPPYIKRPDEPEDRTSYQTVYARVLGSVAAPTAGLHFTEKLLMRLGERGIQIARVILHVGPGTFRPVRGKDLRKHRLHEEWFSIPEETSQILAETRRRGGRIVSVGTTTVRALETAAKRRPASGSFCPPGSGRTDLFIHPPFHFDLTDVLITNFHLPRSTLLMLVCAFGGREFVLSAYEEAVRQGYRFYSYGDAMLIL